MTLFDNLIERVRPTEGGYVNRPDDPGGETNFGITWPVLLFAIFSKTVPSDTTIGTLTWPLAKEIYRVHFWNVLQADRLHDGVAYQLLDFAIHSGIDNAIRAYQRALEVADDGRFGPISRAASMVVSESDQIMRLNAERLDFMRRLVNWPVAGKGWAGRIANNLRYGALDS